MLLIWGWCRCYTGHAHSLSTLFSLDLRLPGFSSFLSSLSLGQLIRDFYLWSSWFSCWYTALIFIVPAAITIILQTCRWLSYFVAFNVRLNIVFGTFAFFSIFLIYLLNRCFCRRCTISTPYTFALIGTHHSELETLTVTFTAAWSFTCTSFSVHWFFVSILGQFFDKSIWVSFHDVGFRLCN